MSNFISIPEAISELHLGKMLIVVDGKDRENQADIIFPAELVTNEKINFLMQFCKGFICVPITTQKAVDLNLPLMVGKQQNTEKTGVNFTISVDSKDVEDFGISSMDRVKTIKTIVNPKSKPTDLVRPGHMFPLLCAKNGLKERQGHTEATIELCKLAGFQKIGVLCEILLNNGEVARMPYLIEFAQKYNLKIVSIADLIKYTSKNDAISTKEVSSTVKTATATLPTRYGTFKISIFKSLEDNQEHTALLMGKVDKKPILTRIHSQCLTGDTLFSLKCDCGEQLEKSLEIIGKQGSGVILYLNQEGRGIGLTNKIKAYALQEKGLDTVEANQGLGLPIDARDYKIAADMLKDLGICKINLLTNNLDKLNQLAEYGIKINKRISLEIKPQEFDVEYLKTKKQKLCHQLDQV